MFKSQLAATHSPEPPGPEPPAPNAPRAPEIRPPEPPLDHPNRVAIEREVSEAFTAIAGAQPGLRVEGRYQQLIETPSQIPDGTTPQERDLDRRPMDYPAGRTWRTIDGLPAGPGLAQLAVHEYLGPLGAGYVMLGRVRSGGSVWTFRRHIGPEAYRDAGANEWHKETLGG